MKMTIRLLALLMVGLLSSCHYLDKFPDSNSDTRIDDLDKIENLLTGAYPQSSYFRFLELRTDNVGDKRNDLKQTKLDESMYYWRDFDELEPDSPKAYWLECYRGIGQANEALEQLAKYQDKNDPKVQALYAEAFLLRAYLHFMVANIWAPPYQGAEESKTLQGIPYVEKPEKHALVDYKPATLQDTYEKIERDLRYGLSWVRDDYYEHPKFHFNKKAAYAFAVRFFAYVGKWQEVVDYSSYVLGSQPDKAITPYLTISTMNENARAHYYSSVKRNSNLLLTTTESLWYDDYINGLYGLDRNTFEKVIGRNGAKTLNQMAGMNKQVIYTEQNTAYIPKFYEFRNAEGLLNSKRGHFTMNVLFTTEEVLLHRAEAYAMLDNYELAMSDINTYFMANHVTAPGVGEPLTSADMDLIDTKDRERVQPFYRPLNAHQASLVYIVSELMRQQFVHEGMRWFDLRRYNMSVDRNHVGEVRQTKLILRAEDSRKTLKFPDEYEVTLSEKE